MISELIAIMAPIVITVGIGYIWGRSDSAYPAEFISRIVMNVGTPCLIVSTMAKVDVDAGIMGEVMFATALAMTFMGLASWALLRVGKLDVPTYLPPLMFPNNGNMGLPLCMFAFGELGLALALGSFMVMMIATFTVGLLLVSDVQGGWGARLKNLAQQPVMYAMVVALGLLVTETRLPAWLDNTTTLIGGFAIPLMTITLGVSLATLKLGGFKRSFWLSVIRIFGGLALGWVSCWLLAVEGVSRSVVLLQSAMPVAVFNYLLALRYNRNPQEIAATVVISTLMAFVVLPFLLVLLLPG